MWVLICCGLALQINLLANQRNYLNDHWTATGEFVYMMVNHSTNDEPLVDNPNKTRYCGGCHDYSVLKVKDLDNNYEPGYRAGLTYLPNYWMSIEGKFLYLRSATESRVIRGSNLYYPFCDLSSTTDYRAAVAARATYTTNFWDVELNYWWHMTPRWVDYFSVSLLGGLRYFNETESLSDKFSNTITGSSTLKRSTLKTWTENNIGGVQVGLNLQINPAHYFSWEINAKGGLMENHARSGSFVRDQNNSVSLNHWKETKWQFGLFADLSAALVFSFARHFDFHIGYDFLILSNLASAKDQLPSCAFKRTHGLNVDSTVSVYGVYAGLGISF